MTVEDSTHSEVAQIALRAVKIAQERGHDMVTMEHILFALLERDEVKECLKTISVPIEEIELVIKDALDSGIYGYSDEILTGAQPMISVDVHAIIAKAIGFARFSPKRVAGPLDLLLHLLIHPVTDSPSVVALRNAGLTQIALKRYMSHGLSEHKQPDAGMMMPGMPGMSDPEPTNVSEAEKVLKKYCLNLNEEAKQSRIDPVIGRAEEIDSIIRITARRTKNNIIMVGDPGVGKTAIAEGMALKIVRGEVPSVLKDSVIWSLDIGALVAGTRFRGDFEERLKIVLKSLAMFPKSVLFIDEIHSIMNAGGVSKGSLDLANLLKPALARGELRCIGSTNYEQYREFFEKDRALNRRFQRVDIGEPSVEDAKLILRGLRKNYELFHEVSYSDEALDAAVDLTYKFIHNALLPDKAIDVMDAAGARNKVATIENKVDTIGPDQIEKEVAFKARVPIKTVSETENDRLEHLETDLKSVVFGQDKAIIAVTDAVLVARAGLRETNKTMGSYLFTGPTGVGKTEIAKQLAKSLGVEFVRFDMSEYMERHSVSRLIGAPPGYVGYGEGGSGLLINAIDTHPMCVLLLDEVEKAHQDIFNILLQVMDDARLTGSTGKEVDFRNVILIMTSNAGAAGLDRKSIGFGNMGEPTPDADAVKRIFSPEFRNRLDSIVNFDRLKPETMLNIVDKFLVNLNKLAADKKVIIQVTEEAKKWLAKNGYDPLYGARPLNRLIKDTISTPLSRIMLFGDLKNGGNALIEEKNNKLEIRVI